MVPRRLLPLLVLLFAWVHAGPAGARAQECGDGRVSHVFVDNHSIFDTAEMDDETPFLWAYELANTLHVETREGFIRGELLFDVGDCFDPFLLEESERILRNHGFIARVDVFGVPQPDGTYHVVVDTRDEWTTKLNVGLAFDDGLQLENLSLTEENFLGHGVLAGFFFRERRERRDLGAFLETPRFLGSRWDAQVAAGRTRIGTFLAQGFAYPFVGETGRVAVRQRFSRRDVLFPFAVEGEPEFTHVVLPYERGSFEATVAGRTGEPGDLTVYGAGLLRETTSFEGFPGDVEVTPTGEFSETRPAGPGEVAAVTPQVRPSSIFRVNLLAGRRKIRFVQRTGLDGLAEIQDIPTGTDVGLTVGKSLGDLGSGGRDAPDDLYLRFHGYGGLAPGDWTLGANADLEGRYVFESAGDDRSFGDLLADLDLYTYWQPSALPSHTLFGRVSGSGGWSMRRPFQLTLGGRTAVRGFREPDFPGGERVVLTLEDRIHVEWPAPELFDLGFTLFADGGRMWAGDVPFGRTTGWQASAGAGLRLGFPPGTRNITRIDLAFPLTGPERLSGPVFRVSSRELLGFLLGFADEEVVRSRRHAVGTDLLVRERP